LCPPPGSPSPQEEERREREEKNCVQLVTGFYRDLSVLINLYDFEFVFFNFAFQDLTALLQPSGV
jgi:hypothetical protein